MKKMLPLLCAFTIVLAAACNRKAERTSETTTTTAPTELSAVDTKAITDKEISVWEFAKTKQIDRLNELLADDYQAYFGKVVMSKAEVMQSYQKSIINVYRLSKIRVKKVADNTAIIYYEALQDATDPEGERWVPQVAASDVYVKRGDVWYAVFYHETPMFE